MEREEKITSLSLYSCFKSIFYETHFPLFMLSNLSGAELLFVEPTAKDDEPGSIPFQIVEKLKHQLNTAAFSSFSIVGPSAIGKTSTALHLTDQLWKAERKMDGKTSSRVNSVIPIYIPLRQIESIAQSYEMSTSNGFDIIQVYLKVHENIFKLCKFDLKCIHFHLKTNWRLILIMDGYDEMQHQNYNLWETNKWTVDFEATVSTVVFSKNLQITNSKLRENLKFKIDVSVIQPEFYEMLQFVDSKVDLFIEKSVTFLKSIDLNNSQNCDDPWVITKTFTQDTDWEKDSDLYQTWFRTILPALSQVAKTPFILIMLVQMLPGVVYESSLNISDCYEYSRDIIQKICATELQIYTKFVDSWFAFYQRKAKNDAKINLIPGFVEKISYFYEAYATNLSTLVLFKNRGFLMDGLLSESDTEKWDLWVPRFEGLSVYQRQGHHSNESLLEFSSKNDLFATADSTTNDKHIGNLRLLRNACFLKKVQSSYKDKNIYKFLHTSIIEYFGSREIFGGLRSQLDQIIQNQTNTFSFNTHIITDPEFTGVMTFLIQKVREDPEFYKTLEQCVLLSAEVYGIQRLAANAISVINMAGMPLPTRLKNVQIPGANLAKCIAGNVDFSGANLAETVLTQGWAPQADFRGANLQGCIIGHEAPFRVFSNCININCFVTLGNKYVVCSFIDKTIWTYSLDHSIGKSAYQITIPTKKGDRPEKMHLLSAIDNDRILIVRVGFERILLGPGTYDMQHCIDNIFVYEPRKNVLQKIDKVWDVASNAKNISIIFEDESDNEIDQAMQEVLDDYEEVEFNVDKICFGSEIEFRDKFDYMLKITSYDLTNTCNNNHLLVLQTFTKQTLGGNRYENYEFKRTNFNPMFGEKLSILSTPTEFTIYSNRDLIDFIVDFNSTTNPTLSLSFFSKKTVTVFLIDLLTLKWTKTTIQVPKFQFYSHFFTMFSPNGTFFIVHTVNPNIYQRQSGTWINVSDNVTESESKFYCSVDSGNRFLAFSRKNYIGVCNLRSGIVFQKISRLMYGLGSFTFFTDKYNEKLCLLYQNGSAIESTQIVENTNRNHKDEVSYDVIRVSDDGKKLVASFKKESDATDHSYLMHVFDIESFSIHTKRNLVFDIFMTYIGDNSTAFFNEFLVVDDTEQINIWKLSKNTEPISCPDYLKTGKVFFLEKIKMIMYIDDNVLRFCEVGEGNDRDLHLKLSLPIPPSVVDDIFSGFFLHFLDMNYANLVYLVCNIPIAVVDLKNETVKTVQYLKNSDFGLDSRICRKFCFDLKLGDMDESYDNNASYSVIMKQRKSLQNADPLPYDWSYDEKVIAVALPGRLVQILDMDFQILFQFQGFYEICGVKLLPSLIPESESENVENGEVNVLAKDLLMWNNSGLLTRLSDISLSSKSYATSKWSVVSTQASSESLCLSNAAMNQCHKTTTNYDEIFHYYDCSGNPSNRSYRSYPELFKAVREDDKSIFELNETEIRINLRTNWSIFVVSRELQDEYLPVSRIDSHVALIIEGMRNDRHFVVRAELILNHRNKFEIKMESIDEKSAFSAAQYISCGWERDQSIVLKLIDEIWSDKHKFEDEKHKYHMMYNNCCKYITDKLENIGIIIPAREIFGRKVYIPWDMMRRRNKKIGFQHLCRIGLWFVIAYSQHRSARNDLQVASFWMLAMIVAIITFYGKIK